jgi:hypothetical protein
MDDQEIEKQLATRMQKNTRTSKESQWRQFERFLEDEKKVFDPSQGDEDINYLLKRFAFNMRKVDGDDYKDDSLKSAWNSVAKQIMEKVYKATGRNINIFKDPVFQEARDSKFVKRRELQKNPLKRKVSATPLTATESRSMISLWGTETPEGLNRTVFHLGGFVLAGRGNDQSSWRLEHFEKQLDNRGEFTGLKIFIFFI